MNIGFTGTRTGMTESQREGVARILSVYAFRSQSEAHHGDCVGADEQFHDLAGRMNLIRIVHPPDKSALRANVQFYDAIREPKPYLARNRDIVDETDVLIATPKESEVPRYVSGGTWFTVHYAIKQGKRVFVVAPDGTLTKHNIPMFRLIGMRGTVPSNSHTQQGESN